MYLICNKVGICLKINSLYKITKTKLSFIKNGRCIKCGSDKVYSSVDGITSGGDNTIVRHTGLFSSYPERVTCICADCGYYENYIENMRILEKIAAKWKKV